MFSAFGDVRSAYVWGSQTFREGLGLRKNFAYVLPTVGIVISKIVRISYTYPISAPKPIRNKLTHIVSVSVMKK